MKPGKDVSSRSQKRDLNGNAKDSTGKGTSTGSGSTPTHLTRIISACSRCRSRKTRCDQKFPSCSACLKAGVECVGLDAATGREVPRSYVSHLEDRVAFLEIQLQNQGIPVEQTQFSKGSNYNNTVSAVSNGKLSSEISAVPKDVDSLVSTVGLVSMKGASTLTSPSFLGLSSGISFARLMFAAVKLRGQDIPSSVPTSEQQPDMTVQHKSIPVESAQLPSKKNAETLIEVFFNQANAQIPIFHRHDFITTYFEPVYGPFTRETKLANINNVRNDSSSSNSRSSTDSNSPSSTIRLESVIKQEEDNDTTHHPNIANTPEVNRALYFLNLVFAIGVAAHQQQYPALVCESYHSAAMKHIEPVFACVDRLESLQGILLLALYSIMRPAVPGVWYVLGVALRLCVDLGLHVEGGVKAWSGSNLLQKNNSSTNINANSESNNGTSDKQESKSFDARITDLRRRLFWCTYAMDRQVCVYLGRPFGIADSSIKVPFPSDLDDVFITSQGIVNPPEDTPPSYKQVAVHIFQIRRLQSEVQTILYERAELPRRFATLKEWQTNMARRLEEWNNTAPKSIKDMNCNFNPYFLDLNYHQTRLLLHGISPAIPRPSVEAFFVIYDASEKVIRAYRQLHRERNINYTWMAVHNLFMAGTSYLYCLYHSKEVRQRTRMDVIDFNTMACIHVLTAMIDKCDAASGCRDTFELLTAAILRLCYNEKYASGEISSLTGPAVTGPQISSEETAKKTAVPPVPPPMPPPAKRTKRSGRLSSESQAPGLVGQPQSILNSSYSPMYPSQQTVDFSSTVSPSVSPTAIQVNTVNSNGSVSGMQGQPIDISSVPSNGHTPSSQASTPTSERTNGLSPFASFESNTIQWMADMESDLDEIFRTAAEIQSVPPMHGNFTHPVAYSGNVSGNTQGGGYAYQFSPSATVQQYGSSGSYVPYENAKSSASTTSPVESVSNNSLSPSDPRWSSGSQSFPTPQPVQSLQPSSNTQTPSTVVYGSQQQQQLFDDEYDGQRIYEMMYELPSASIWEQFFAVPGSSSFASVASGIGTMQMPPAPNKQVNQSSITPTAQPSGGQVNNGTPQVPYYNQNNIY
ncbi:fungal-specific transcription factor domain-containing protein [Dipodascopsis uninucleata]